MSRGGASWYRGGAVVLGGLASVLAGLAPLALTSCAESNDEPTPLDVPDARPSLDAGSDVVDARSDLDADAGAAAWSPVTTSHDTRLGLSAIWGTGRSDVWAVGAAGSVLHFDGSTWSSTSLGTQASLNAVVGSSPTDVWVASSVSQIFHLRGFEGGALQWFPATEIAPFADDRFVRAAWAGSPSDVWLGAEGVDVFKDPSNTWRSSTTDEGLVWQPMSFMGFSIGNSFTPSIFGIWGSAVDDVWVVGTQAAPASYAAHTDGVPGDDGMPTWTELDTQSNSPLNAIWGVDAGDVWAVGDYGVIRRFRGAPAAGAAWEIVSSPTTEDLRGVWGSSGTDIWAVGDHGTFLHYDGDSWQSVGAVFPSGTVPNLRAIWGADSNDVWAVGDGIVMHHSRSEARAERGSP